MKIYQCKKCNKIIVSKDELPFLGLEEVQAGVVDAAKEKHVPVVTVDGNLVKVDVGSVSHPMTAEHLIEWVVIETAQGYQVKYLKAGDAPVCNFVLAGDDSLVAVYAYCNLHGLWKA